MEENQLKQDLSSIRNMMERSSKFISLSGLSGILAGIYALAGVGIAHYFIHKIELFSKPIGLDGSMVTFDNMLDSVYYLMLIAITVLIASILTGFVLTYRKAKRNGQSVWSKTSRALLFNMAIPLVSGGILVIILTYQMQIGLLLPTTLIFYGLALVNASNFTFTDVKYLGICEIVLGLIAACIPGYGLIFWAIGFGVLHIIYGTVMYLKYDRESSI